jgi:uncharacterized damage-inducible protein DinB
MSTSVTEDGDMPGLAEMHANELELLLAYVAQQRDGILNATYGLTDEQAASQPTISGLSLITLVQHAAEIEQVWITLATDGSWENDYERYQSAFVLGERTLADVVAHYRAVAAATEMSVREAGDLDRMVPVPKGVPWFPDDVEAWSVRWILLHLMEEVARHAGHADFLREAIDGATMHQLMATVEDWPDSPWLTKWTPAVT